MAKRFVNLDDEAVENLWLHRPKTKNYTREDEKKSEKLISAGGGAYLVVQSVYVASSFLIYICCFFFLLDLLSHTINTESYM